jgi:hypothetical protein
VSRRPKFLPLNSFAIDHLADDHQLDVWARWILLAVTRWSDWRPGPNQGRWDGTIDELSQGMSRNTAPKKLAELQEEGLIEYEQNTRSVSVRVLCYNQLVYSRPSRASERAGRSGGEPDYELAPYPSRAKDVPTNQSSLHQPTKRDHESPAVAHNDARPLREDCASAARTKSADTRTRATERDPGARALALVDRYFPGAVGIDHEGTTK